MHSTSANDDAAHRSADALTFTPPRPGVWELDVDHQHEPRGALFFDLFSEPFRSGFAEMFKRYGLPLKELRSASIHGWHYTSAKPLGAPEGKGAGGPPPDFALKVLSRVHPEFRRRNRTAAAAIRDRLWLRDAEEWQHERSTWVGHCTQLDATALDELNDDELMRLAGEAGQLGRDMMRRHFALVGPALAAGRLLAAGGEWGLDPAQLLDLFTGASPASAATAPALETIREQLVEAGVDPMGFYLANKVSREREPSAQLMGTTHINGQQVATGYRLGGEVTARVVVVRSSSEAIERAEPGVILACPVTTPAWNVIFPMLAGIVTSTGSPLGHTAVMAREFGLPAVVGVGELDSVWHGMSATLNRGMADGRNRDS